MSFFPGYRGQPQKHKQHPWSTMGAQWLLKSIFLQHYSLFGISDIILRLKAEIPGPREYVVCNRGALQTSVASGAMGKHEPKHF